MDEGLSCSRPEEKERSSVQMLKHTLLKECERNHSGTLQFPDQSSSDTDGESSSCEESVSIFSHEGQRRFSM